MTDKICTLCKNEKPRIAFSKSNATKDGYKCWCKECVAKDTKAKRKADPERSRSYGRKCYAKHRKERSQASKERYKRTKEHKLERAKRQRRENPEHFRLISARCYMRNIEKRKAYAKRYRAENKERFYQWGKIYRNRGLSLDVPNSKDGDSNKLVRDEWQRRQENHEAHIEACETLAALGEYLTPEQAIFLDTLLDHDFDMNAVAGALNITTDACNEIMATIRQTATNVLVH